MGERRIGASRHGGRWAAARSVGCRAVAVAGLLSAAALGLAPAASAASAAGPAASVYGELINNTPYTMTEHASLAAEPDQQQVSPGYTASWRADAAGPYDVTYTFVDGAGSQETVGMTMAGAGRYACAVTGTDAANWVCEAGAGDGGETFTVQPEDTGSWYTELQNQTPFTLHLVSAEATPGWSDNRAPTQRDVEPTNTSDWWIKNSDADDVQYRFTDDQGRTQTVDMTQHTVDGHVQYGCAVSGPDAVDWMCDPSGTASGKQFIVEHEIHGVP